MCTHLSRRGATYYFRRVIPDDVRSAFGDKAEWVHSLRTKDRDEAKRRAQDETVRTNDLIDAARAALSVAPVEAADGPQSEKPEWQQEREEFALREAEERQERRRHRRPKRDEFRKRMGLSTEFLGSTEQVARDIIEEERALHEAELAALRRQIEAAQKERVVTQAPRSGPGKDIRLGEVLEKWAAERKPGEKGRLEHAAVARWFKESAGDKTVGDIARQDVHAFVDKMIAEGQNPANINIKISRLRTLLGFALHKGWADNNAASGIKVKVPDAAANKRKPFGLADLNAVFSSPIYSQGKRPIQGRGEAAYWLPLLGLYTGARREELGQLRIQDIELRSYVDGDDNMQSSWFIRITTDKKDDLKLKNAESERLVPVHPEIEKLGFIRYVESLKEAGTHRLFPDLKPGAFNRLTPKWGEWFSRYRRDVCGITDKRLVFHSFRHTFKDMARRSKIEEGLQRQIMGHSPGDIPGEYGEGFDEYRVVEAMRQYRVPGFTPPAPSPFKS